MEQRALCSSHTVFFHGSLQRMPQGGKTSELKLQLSWH